jgi:hypothetical protein
MMVKFKKMFSVAKSHLIQAKGKINLMSCLHIWKPMTCLGRIAQASVPMVPHQWLAPLKRKS